MHEQKAAVMTHPFFQTKSSDPHHNQTDTLCFQKELDLKKAAKAVNEKSIEMLKQKDLLPLTGYIHGGCSPIGMKKFFKTTIDDSAKQFQTIIFSAGKIGYQVEVTLEDLSKVIRYDLCDITKDVEL